MPGTGRSAGAPRGLLAQPTDTPPPAQAPRRSAARRAKVWIPLLLLLAGAAAGAQLLRPLPAPQLVATEQSHSVEGRLSIPWPEEGQGAVRLPGTGTIATFGAQKPVPTASVAKIMTAYVVLKDHPLRKGETGPTITVDAKTVAEGRSENESRITGLTEGSTFSQLDMLKMLMIPSGNNAARLLARWSTGSDSEAAFVDRMNAAAHELGMNNTTYTDPSGLDAGTVSTAVDQLKLAEAVMKDDVFRSVVALPDAEIKNLSQRLINNNTLLNAPELSIRGIKTGSSTPAGGALVWAGYKSVGEETPLILGALMDQRVDGPDPNATRSLALVLANSKKVVESVRSALTSAQVVRKGETVGYVDDGLGGHTPLVAAADLTVVAAPGQTLRLALGRSSGEGTKAAVPRTAAAGTEVGVLSVGEGTGLRSVPVVVGRELAEPSIGTRLTRIG
ncbi:D-alanyl-D-alanine carboxypeptidase family protein [Streptomyces sp. NPDC014870]|uniref:D-alanyl-D-alanine carboxypeptidase family protein n=1 Tax=Streptomyces sp. NPDC014870 TaxID=3364925 RepID=UPI0036F9E8F8